MPELPEVETIRRDLHRVLRGKHLRAVDVRNPKLVKGVVRTFTATLRGQTIARVDRRGKLLIVHFMDPRAHLLLHLKMTGQLIYRRKKTLLTGGHPFPAVDIHDLPSKYTHLIFHLSDGSTLYLNDLRQFGYAKLVSTGRLQIILNSYGIEPLTPNFTLANFSARVRARNAPIKSVLLNQAIIAGLGNIYADEICFAARVRPNRRARSLTPRELKKLLLATQRIIEAAIKYRGTTFDNYRDSQGRRGNYVRLLKVYGRGDKSCRRCGKKLQKAKIAGRGTVVCFHCQV